jgi:hypothetical protein
MENSDDDYDDDYQSGIDSVNTLITQEEALRIMTDEERELADLLYAN